MDWPDAVGHFRRQRGVSSAAQGDHAGPAGCGAPRACTCGSTGRSVRGYRAGHFAGGASEAAHLGCERPVRALAVCHCPQQADRCVAPAWQAHLRQYRRFRRDARRPAGCRDRVAGGGRNATEYAAGAAARRAAIDRGRKRIDQGYRGKACDQRGRGAGRFAPGPGESHGKTEGAVRMDTDQLIRTLAADNTHRSRPVGFVLALALLAAFPVSLLMFFAELGVRPDVMTAMHDPFFDLKFAITLALAAAAITVGLHLARPEAELRGWIWLLAIPAGLLVAGISGEMTMPQRLPMMTRMVGHNSKVCMTAVPLMSLPLLAAALIGLRHGAPARPALAGALAGMMSAGLAATLYASHCTDDSPLFVAAWYTLATALVTAVGALVGSRVLRY